MLGHEFAKFIVAMVFDQCDHFFVLLIALEPLFFHIDMVCNVHEILIIFKILFGIANEEFVSRATNDGRIKGGIEGVTFATIRFDIAVLVL